MNKKVYFLERNLWASLTGIEHSAILRSSIFRQELNIFPCFLTAEYNSHLSIYKENLYASGKIDRRCEIVGMYEWIQGTEPYFQSEEDDTHSLKDIFETKEVTGLKDYRVYDDQPAMFMYRKYSEQGKHLYDNIFSKKKKIRRDYYDSNGCLSMIQHLDASEKVMLEQYFHVQGWICMYKFYNVDEKNRKLTGIHLLDKQGAIKNVFRSETELIRFWLKAMTEKEKAFILIVDKIRIYQEALDTMELSNGKVIYLIHSSHISEGTDYMNGRINSNYVGVFKNLSKPDAVVCLTNRQRGQIEERFGKQNNLYVIPHSAEGNIEKADFDRRRRNGAICLGRYAPEKQYDKLINVFKMVVEECPKATLGIYGAGSLKKDIIKQVADLNLKDNIFVNDYAENKEEIYNTAAVGILASRVEGFPLFLLECISHGCAVVSYDVNYGPEDLIDDGVNGYLIDPGNERQMADAIISIFNSQELSSKMSNASYGKSKYFSSGHVASLWGKLLEEI